MRGATTAVKPSRRPLPAALWIPGTTSPAIYRGSALEMVAQMKKEMSPSDISTRLAVRALILGLRENRGIRIHASGSTEESLALSFITGLLDSGLGREVPLA